MIIWALFDSGDGSYTRALQDKHQVIAVGIDKLKPDRDDFINLDLADNGILFGDTTLFDRLDQLPKPDIILASPPCESWSVASAMLRGNTFWYDSTTVFNDGTTEESKFTIRTRKHLATKDHTPYKKDFVKSVRNRINGELCVLNTLEIIKRYQPKHFIIENPMTSKVWSYITDVHDFPGYRNKCRYNNYDENYPQKPTIFFSDIKLNLDSSVKRSEVMVGSGRGANGRKMLNNYNDRSSIPDKLIQDAVNQLENTQPKLL